MANIQIKKVTLSKLVKTIAALKVGEGMKFFYNFDSNGLSKEEIEEELKDEFSSFLTGAYSISKLNYLDSTLLIVGGFDNPTISEWLTEEETSEEEPITRLLNDYFDIEKWTTENGEVVVWLSNKVYNLSLNNNF